MNNTNRNQWRSVRDSEKTTYTKQEIVDLFHLMTDEQENLIHDFMQWIAEQGYIIDHSMGRWYYDGFKIDNLDLFHKWFYSVTKSKEGEQ